MSLRNVLVALTPAEEFPNTLKGISGNLEAHDAHVWTWLCSSWGPWSCYSIQMVVKLLVTPAGKSL